MPSNEKSFPSGVASNIADLHPNFEPHYWKFVEICLREVFHKSKHQAQEAVRNFRERMGRVSDEEVLLLYHTSPLQIAANLAGAARRSLTAEELLAYEKLQNDGRPDRPSREQILQVHTLNPKAG